MAAYTLTLTNTCAGGNHVTVSVTGTSSLTIETSRDEIMQGERNPRLLCVLLMRELARGRTANQVATILNNGLNVQIGP